MGQIMHIMVISFPNTQFLRRIAISPQISQITQTFLRKLNNS